MSFPASTQLLAQALSSACQAAVNMKNNAVSIRTRSAAGNINRTDVTQFLSQLNVVISQWTAIQSLSGIGAYAQQQLGSPTLDAVAEFGGMVTQATALRDWIVANFPKDAVSGAWLLTSFDATGAQQVLQFTSAQLAAFRTQLAAFEATIS